MVAYPARLGGAAGRVRLGIEVQDDGLAAEVRELHSTPVLVGQLEVGGHGAGIDHARILMDACSIIGSPRRASSARAETDLTRANARLEPIETACLPALECVSEDDAQTSRHLHRFAAKSRARG